MGAEIVVEPSEITRKVHKTIENVRILLNGEFICSGVLGGGDAWEYWIVFRANQPNSVEISCGTLEIVGK